MKKATTGKAKKPSATSKKFGPGQAGTVPSPGPVPAVTAKEKRTRKNHYLHQSKLDLAKKVLGAKTETEALDKALDLVIYGELMAKGTERMVGEDYHDVLGLVEEIPAE